MATTTSMPRSPGSGRPVTYAQQYGTTGCPRARCRLQPQRHGQILVLPTHDRLRAWPRWGQRHPVADLLRSSSPGPLLGKAALATMAALSSPALRMDLSAMGRQPLGHRSQPVRPGLHAHRRWSLPPVSSTTVLASMVIFTSCCTPRSAWSGSCCCAVTSARACAQFRCRTRSIKLCQGRRGSGSRQH